MNIELDHVEGKDYVKIPVVKASTREEPSWVEVCIDDLPADVYKEVLLQGLKTLLNRGMSKITGTKTEKSIEAAMEVASANLTNLYEGKVRMSAGVRSKVSGAVKVEAMRIARLLVKDALKRAGMKVSHIPAKEITAAAQELLDGEQGKEIIAQATDTIKEREEKEKGIKIDVTKIKVDPKLVAAAEKKAKENREATAAKKAGSQVTQRAKPKGEGQHVTH